MGFHWLLGLILHHPAGCDGSNMVVSVCVSMVTMRYRDNGTTTTTFKC